ncbi:hypothetical protein QJS66_17650 [Kocuria rhizophila]|nr:hypothetical protein QJS66_17650 [Kocuria rhizophila]
MAFVVPSWLGPSVPADLLDKLVLALVVGGMTMVVGAGLGLGLVATTRSPADDDDSPLRPTDYADRLRGASAAPAAPTRFGLDRTRPPRLTPPPGAGCSPRKQQSMDSTSARPHPTWLRRPGAVSRAFLELSRA